MTKKSKKWYKTWWAITLMVIVGLMIFAVLYSAITGIPIVSIETVSETNSEYRELDAIEQLTAEDCSKPLSNCEGTTKINYSYQFIDGDCVEEITSNENSFDCGYILPCDLTVCKLKDTNICEETTKVITTYFCDNKLGCTNKVIKKEDSIDCGYLYSGKYSIDDINFIKKTAKDCKEYEKLADCYTVPTDIKFMDDKGSIIVNTPFYETLKQIDYKERLYNAYTDEDIITFLDTNRVDFFIVYYSSEGLFKKAVIKYNGEIYDLKDVTYDYSLSYLYGINRKAVRLNDFSNFWDKKIELVVILNENNKLTEYSKIIDLSKYR